MRCISLSGFVEATDIEKLIFFAHVRDNGILIW